MANTLAVQSQELKAERSIVQGHSQLHNEFEASLDYMRTPVSKKTHNDKVIFISNSLNWPNSTYIQPKKHVRSQRLEPSMWVTFGIKGSKDSNTSLFYTMACSHLSALCSPLIVAWHCQTVRPELVVILFSKQPNQTYIVRWECRFSFLYPD